MPQEQIAAEGKCSHTCRSISTAYFKKMYDIYKKVDKAGVFLCVIFFPCSSLK